MPTVWSGLERNGTHFLRGQLVLISAGPGTGKSAFVLSLALQSGAATLYFSADSDAFTQLVRSISILTDKTQTEAAQAVHSNNLEDVQDQLRASPIRFSYDANPSIDSIESTLEAYEEVYGEYPGLIIVDNITNVRTAGGDDDDPFSGLEGLMDYLHTMSRATEACVICLHHVTGFYNDADRAIPMSGVKQQITRVPETVLTLHKRHGDDMGSAVLCVSTVKNRGGRADPSGRTYAELMFVPDRMKITDPQSF